MQQPCMLSAGPKVIYETRDLGSVNASIDDVPDARAKARIVLPPRPERRLA